MSFRTVSACAIFAVACVACTGTLTPLGDDDGGGGDDTGGPATTGEAMFQTDVQPLMAACSGCHVGTPGQIALPFLGNAGVAGFYDAIVVSSVVSGWNPATASLLTKGAHQGAPAWTATQAELITDWMMVEASER